MTYAIRTLLCAGCGTERVGRYPPGQRCCSRSCRWPRRLIKTVDGFAIPLYDRKNVVVAQAKIDKVDAALGEHRWHLTRQGYAATRMMRDGQRRIEILGLAHGDARQADHVDGNRLDCRRTNLRIVTAAQNSQNRAPVGGSSQYRGVCFHKQSGRWLAYGSVNHRRENLGLHATEADAAEVAKQWRLARMSHTNEARVARV